MPMKLLYISSYIAKTIKKKIDCFFCQQLLVLSEAQKESNAYRSDNLLQRKNRSGLCKPSSDVIITCKNAEKTLRYNQDRLFKTKNILNVLICQSLRSLSLYIFNINDHIYDQSPLFDHRSQIIKLFGNLF